MEHVRHQETTNPAKMLRSSHTSLNFVVDARARSQFSTPDKRIFVGIQTYYRNTTVFRNFLRGELLAISMPGENRPGPQYMEQVLAAKGQQDSHVLSITLAAGNSEAGTFRAPIPRRLLTSP